MKMEKTKIKINVDQATAIRMGKSEYGEFTIEINPGELTPAQRETLAACDYDSGRIPRPQHYRYHLPSVGEATLETAKILLDALAAEKIRIAEKEKTEREEKIKKALSLPMDAFWMFPSWPAVKDRYHFRDYEIAGVKEDPRIIDLVTKVKAKIAELNAERDINEAGYNKEKAARDKADAEEKAEKERLKAEKEAGKQRQIAAWVAAHGTDNQKKRAALNLLPREEVVDAMRAAAFAPLDEFPRYEKLTPQDVPCWCSEYDDDAPHAKFSTEDAETATADQFDLLERIQTLLPAAQVTLRVHRGWCTECETPDDEDGNVERYSIRVAITVGAFNFTREYAV